ncbi:4584_t:CDS:2, partial [Acaulospora colombiana]
ALALSALFNLRQSPLLSREMATTTSMANLATLEEINDEYLENARASATRALQAPLSLLTTKDEFRAEAGQIAAIVENANPEDPRMLAVEVEAHKQYVAKLKFKYQEKSAKLKLSNILCQEEPPDFSPEVMDAIKAEAADAKAELKLKKEMLADAYDRMRILIPEWHKQYSDLVAKAERTERLTREIQAAKMELAQIRARHPEPRLTLDQASQYCDEQMEQFIALSEKRDELLAQAKNAKERAEREEAKTRMLREDVMKKEREADRIKEKVQSAGEKSGLPDWLASYSEFLGSYTWVSSVHQETDNELRLRLNPPDLQQPVTLSVVFDPAKCTLAGAQLIDSPIELDEEPIAVCVTKNDFVQLVQLTQLCCHLRPCNECRKDVRMSQLDSWVKFRPLRGRDVARIPLGLSKVYTCLPAQTKSIARGVLLPRLSVWLVPHFLLSFTNGPDSISSVVNFILFKRFFESISRLAKCTPAYHLLIVLVTTLGPSTAANLLTVSLHAEDMQTLIGEHMSKLIQMRGMFNEILCAEVSRKMDAVSSRLKIAEFISKTLQQHLESLKSTLEQVRQAGSSSDSGNSRPRTPTATTDIQPVAVTPPVTKFVAPAPPPLMRRHTTTSVPTIKDTPGVGWEERAAAFMLKRQSQRSAMEQQQQQQAVLLQRQQKQQSSISEAPAVSGAKRPPHSPRSTRSPELRPASQRSSFDGSSWGDQD